MYRASVSFTKAENASFVIAPCPEQIASAACAAVSEETNGFSSARSGSYPAQSVGTMSAAGVCAAAFSGGVYASAPAPLPPLCFTRRNCSYTT